MRTIIPLRTVNLLHIGIWSIGIGCHAKDLQVQRRAEEPDLVKSGTRRKGTTLNDPSRAIPSDGTKPVPPRAVRKLEDVVHRSKQSILGALTEGACGAASRELENDHHR